MVAFIGAFHRVLDIPAYRVDALDCLTDARGKGIHLTLCFGQGIHLHGGGFCDFRDGLGDVLRGFSGLVGVRCQLL